MAGYRRGRGQVGKYNDVRIMNALELMNEPTIVYDGIILGDVLEHLPKSQGVDLVNFLVYRCKLMIVIYPIGSIQNNWEHYEHEAHISVWGQDDWQPFEHIAIVDSESELVLIDGYIEHERITIECLQST
jgi:hypothetical protein